MKPTKENTLNLIIKQIYFDLIVSGEKTMEYREIKDSTFNKYLDYSKEEGFLILEDLLKGDIEDIDIYMYNGGEYPFIPKNYEYIQFTVGYAKNRDTMLIEVEDISFEIAKDTQGRQIRFNWNQEEEQEGEESGIIADPEGNFALWQIVYHLGKIIEVNKKDSRN